MAVIYQLISLFLAIYIFFDAKKRLNTGFSILLSVLSYIPIVPILYFTFRNKIPVKTLHQILCPKCGNSCNATAIQCNKCNNTLKI